jgi:hypothetical protein
MERLEQILTENPRSTHAAGVLDPPTAQSLKVITTKVLVLFT